MERYYEELFLKIQGPYACSCSYPASKILWHIFARSGVDVIGLVNTVFCEKTVSTPDNDGWFFHVRCAQQGCSRRRPDIPNETNSAENISCNSEIFSLGKIIGLTRSSWVHEETQTNGTVVVSCWFRPQSIGRQYWFGLAPQLAWIPPTFDKAYPHLEEIVVSW